MVLAEALVRGAWDRIMGRAEDCRAWRTIGEVARQLRAGNYLQGREVLRMAEAVEKEKSDRLDKDGSACHSRSTWSESDF
jgi:hypothetical protein